MKRISVIIPVYNEEAVIEKLQQQLMPLKDSCEIIFLDGGSSDRTEQLLDKRFRVVQGAKGRAMQMNYGASLSTGDILFFLHCDSELPNHAVSQILEVMEKYRAGCFGIAFHTNCFWMKCCQIISNHRAKRKNIMFGDQGIFIDRELFFEIGGFPDLPIMEDYQLSLNLKERNVRTGMTRDKIYTSDRRFIQGGPLRVMWQMNRLRAKYRRGTDIEKIAQLYRDIR